ncbi:MAG TPA: UDP-N-acetylglucosamine 1-carboxyvinyltransferase [Alphaproteobacteria bacterium]|jgi:UDP-N-acetylglucosamine 1-carboxyvinyltransferase|nr:UDP-N-acetylglucosamine 1-carboxyvinyltransferase [Alphaproteobacteria bacterium]MDP6269191.1 UDP-N-acetylglucosamine 1-carboxyvinyltransferase [Alphaproteobacteria bacterium]MDP7426597.1 UDP-N-acetylglucosamine 1-carboxyvinyltransferase [Alphaproteobacteria bacterium]HJM52315.1 UDP-N-acetylglucosamine 1-carboxyvinyltransferase [Alphaproteobacteria bacterium]
MDRIRITGGVPLAGRVRIGGAKNAALKLMAAALLSEGTLRLSNVPHLADVSTLLRLLARLGVEVTMNGDADDEGHVGRVLSLNAAGVHDTLAPYDLVRKMRASVLVLGPLLARRGKARVSLPGGCAIGPRPVDLHLQALADLGAEIELVDGYINASAPGGLRGGEIRFPKVSVGATENALMAATLARGGSVIENAAREPEVAELARCLVAMGARIEGIGSDRLEIEGTDALSGADWRIMPDRIESGTFAAAAAITGGSLELVGARLELMRAVVEALQRIGVEISETEAGLSVVAGGGLAGLDITTQPYPGFPTDMQAQMMALLSVAEGASMISETIFENRFMHVPELCRMGADIVVSGGSAMIRGVSRLKGAPTMATDLRASVSLVLAGLAADGETVVSRVYHLDRGYERLVEKLAGCGALIERLQDEAA